MQKPLYESATIIIPVYNRINLLDRTLDSLSKCKSIHRTQIIVSDDGSSEPIEDLVSSWRKSIDMDYFRQDDKGFRAAKARNIALKHAANPILIFIDNGMYVCPEFIDAHLEAHTAVTEPAMVTGYNFGFDRNNENAEHILQINVSDQFSSVFSGKLEQLLDPREDVFGQCDGNIHALRAPWTLMWTCNVSVERDVFSIVGGFNENFTSWGAEDTELAYRLSRCGIKFLLSRQAKALHMPHPKNGEDLQPQSIANFKRETKQYQDPLILELIDLGDLAVNQSTLRNQ